MAPSPEASKATPILPISQETNLNQVLPFNIRDSDWGWEPKLTIYCHRNVEKREAGSPCNALQCFLSSLLVAKSFILRSPDDLKIKLVYCETPVKVKRMTPISWNCLTFN